MARYHAFSVEAKGEGKYERYIATAEPELPGYDIPDAVPGEKGTAIEGSSGKGSPGMY